MDCEFPPQKSQPKSKRLAFWAFGTLVAAIFWGGIPGLHRATADENPLKKVLKQLFQPLDSENPSAKDPGKGEIADPRAPVDQETTEALQRIRDALKKQREAEVLEELHRIWDRPDDAMVLKGKTRWMSVRQWTRDIYDRLSQRARAEDATHFETTARERWNLALEAVDPRGVAELAWRFPGTTAGIEAANWMASWHFDHGESVTAWFWMKSIKESASPKSVDWKRKAWQVAVSAGDKDWATALEKDLLTATPHQSDAFDPHPVDRKLIAVTQRPAQDVPEDWTVFGGNRERSALQPGGMPGVLPTWTQPSSASDLIRTLCRELEDELHVRGISAIPASYPLVVRNRLIVPTWTGVEVYDLQTGKRLWVAKDAHSSEEILMTFLRRDAGTDEEDAEIPIQRRRMGLGWDDSMTRGTILEFSPLTSFLYRDTNYGIVSSDGQRLFRVRESSQFVQRPPQAVPGGNESNEGDLDPFGRSYSTNVLSAYDLTTGELLWSLGGVEDDAASNSDLTGMYFLGAPLPDGGELLCLAEKNGELQLWGLDPATGKSNWSQRLGFAEAKIGGDQLRQKMSLQPTVTQGVIVCPLMTGWVVALDRMTRSFRWSLQTSPARPHDSSESAVKMPAGLNDRWAITPVIAVGNRLLFADPDGQPLHCLNLRTGEILWTAPRRDGLYVAGVFDTVAVVVGTQHVRAIDLDQGKELWRVPIPEQRHVSGRGVLTSTGMLQLPLSGGELLLISIPDHKVVQRLVPWQMVQADPPMELGNLVRVGSKLCSVHPMGVQVRDDESPQQSTQQESPSAGDMVESSTMQRRKLAMTRAAKGDLPGAWEILSRDPFWQASAMPPAPMSAEDEQFSGELLRSLIVRSTSQGTTLPPALEGAIQRWLAVAQSREMRLHIRIELARSQRRQGKHEAAFASLWPERMTGQLDQLWIRTVDRRQRIRGDLWLSGELQQVWTSATPDVQEKLRPQVREFVQRALQQPFPEQRRCVNLVGFHPESLPLRWQLADVALKQQMFSAAVAGYHDIQVRLPSETQVALTREVQALKAAGRPDDARWVVEQFQAEKSTAINSADWVKGLLSGESLSAPPGAPSAGSSRSWTMSQLKVVPEGANPEHPPKVELQLPEVCAPGWRRWRFFVSDQDQRLVMSDALTDRIEWNLPLRSRAERGESRIESLIVGDRLYLSYRGVLHAMIPAERRLAWTREWEPADEELDEPVSVHKNRSVTLQSPKRWLLSRRLSDDSAASRTVFTLGQGRLAIRQKRMLEILDAETGGTTWSVDGIPQDSEISGDDEFLLVYSPMTGTAEIWNFQTAQRQSISDLAQALQRAVAISGREIIQYRLLSGEQGKRSWTFRRYDPIAKRTVWERSWDVEPLCGGVSERTWLILSNKTSLQRLDLQNGELIELGRVETPNPARRTQEYTLFQDLDQIYLTVSRGSGRTVFQEGLSYVEVDGWVYAYDRSGQGLRWKREIRGKRESGGFALILDAFEQSPVLICTRREYDQQQELGHWRQQLIAVDKRTGQEVLQKSLSPATSFSEYLVHTGSRFLELRGYEQRIRLIPVSAQPTPTSPPPPTGTSPPHK